MHEGSEYYRLIKRDTPDHPLDPDLANHRRLIRDTKHPKKVLEIYQTLVSDLRIWHREHPQEPHPWISTARILSRDLEAELEKPEPDLEVLKAILHTARKPTAEEKAVITQPPPDPNAPKTAYTFSGGETGETFTRYVTDAKLEEVLLLAFCQLGMDQRVAALAQMREDGYIVENIPLPDGMYERMMRDFAINVPGGFPDAFYAAMKIEYQKLPSKMLRRLVMHDGDKVAVSVLADRETIEQVKADTNLNRVMSAFDRARRKK